MTLAEHADAICEKINLHDTATRALVIKWVSRRHAMLCRYALWRDLLNLYTVAVAAGQAEVILGPQVEHVLAVKYDQTQVLAADQVYLFATDPGVWDRTGRAARMAALPALGTRTNPTAELISLVSNNAADISATVSLIGELAGEEMQETVTLNGTTPVVTANQYDRIYSAAKEATAGMVTLSGQTSATTLATIPANETGRRYPRLRLLEIPNEALTLLVLAKRRIRALQVESDETAFAGLDDTLEAFALADAYEWLKQTEDAADKRAEAIALRRELRDEYQYQPANGQRLVPPETEPDWSGEF